jgi:hypothetical protein
MSDHKLGRFQFTLRVLLVFVALCGAGLGAGKYLYSYYVLGPVKDSHTAVQLSAMICAYLDANSCRWPKRWEDLREFFPAGGLVGGKDPVTFSDVRSCWNVDFGADPIQLAQQRPRTDGPPFRVIWQRCRRRLAYPHLDPNLRVFWRLRSNAGLQVAAMIIEFMEAEDGTWPSSWDDLYLVYPVALNEHQKPYCPFAQARGCIEVEFKADPAKLAKANPRPNQAPFRVVFPRHKEPDRRYDTHPGQRDPNQRIYDYLTGKQPRSSRAKILNKNMSQKVCHWMKGI